MLANLFDEIREVARRREDHLRAGNRLILQVKAICRRLTASDLRGLPEKEAKARRAKDLATAQALYAAMSEPDPDVDQGLVLVAQAATADLLAAFDLIRRPRLAAEKTLRQMAEKLPVWPWWESTYGVGALGLALIVAETGDLHNYATVSRVWKRMGLAVIEGERQRRVAGDAELAIRHGYVARRRSIVWNVGDSLLKAAAKPNPYRDFYLEVKARVEAEGKWKEMTKGRKGRIHAHAKRKMEKRLLRDLWVAWRAVESGAASSYIETCPPGGVAA